MARPSKYPREVRESAVRMVAEAVASGEYPSEFEAIRTIASNAGTGSAETLRKCVRQAEVDGGVKPGKTTAELARLIEASVDPSVGSVGDAYDNALAESQIGIYKTELIRPEGPWRGVEHVELETLNWVTWFNNERTHDSIRDLTPVQAEELHYAASNRLVPTG